MRNKKLFIGAVILAAVGLVGIFIAGMVLSAQPGNRPSAGSPAPDFAMTLYKDYRADLPETIKLSDLRGRVVVLNFWASWCVECTKEADALEAVWREYRDRGVIVLGVDYLDTESAALKYLQQYDTTYPNGVDLQQEVSRAYRITGVPETFFIDKEGIVRKTVIQALTKQALVNAIEPMLAE
ncbi:MAG: TlpA family protein disulfide reductase [Chloroflexi bacterium]|nr:TlpA family protein disulfide reductase [Chloroflexota bacterium]